MARKRESLAELLCCVICLENYDEEGQHVPRLLPCSHTVCESCIKDLITNDTLVCPECRKKHRVENKEKSFPQNKYLLAHIQSKEMDAKESLQITQKVPQERCEKHGMELVLFCFEDMCRTSICISCLADHNKHDVKGVEAKEKELLKKDLGFKMILETRLKFISEAKETVDKKTDKCVNDLRKTKDEFIRSFDKMIEEVHDYGNQTNKESEKEMSAITASIEVLNSIQENCEAEDGANQETIANYRETVRAIIENNKANLSGTRSFKFLVFNTDGLSAEIFSKRLASKEHTIVLPDFKKKETQIKKKLPAQISSSHPRCTVTKTFPIEIRDSVYYMALFDDGACMMDKYNKLRRYDTGTGAEVSCVSLSGPTGIAPVQINGKAALAASQCRHGIRFRDAKDVKKILYTYPTYPVTAPGVVCAVTPSTLLFVDQSKSPESPFEVHWLDLSGKEPKPVEGRQTIHTELDRIDDMCFVQDGDKQLLIVTNYKGFFAYNTDTDKLEWKVEKPSQYRGIRTVTTDGHGHLFASDHNNHSILVYSVSDGSYIRSLRGGDNALCKPEFIRWCKKTSSLIVACYSAGKWYLKVINVQF